MKMMKTKNILLIFILLILGYSCENLLEEDYYSGSSIESQVSTASGFENLVTGCYISAKMWYGKEYGWDMTTVGTDCFTYAGDADDMRNLALFSPNFNNSWPGRIGVVWSEFYKALNACNTTLYYLPDAKISDELKITREGEIRFLRAFYLWHIVETWGGVYFSNQPITKPELEMHRSDVDVFYTQIFEDLNKAVEMLPESVSDADYGRVFKYAALAFRARAHLYWAAEYMSGKNYNNKVYEAINGMNHYQQAIADAQAVIANSNFQLYENFADVWKMENNANANVNKENIWAVNYSNSEYAILNVEADEYNGILSGTDPKPFSEREGGNHGHMMFGMRWFAIGGTSTVMVKDDGDDNTATEPTRPFCRYMPTKFMIDLYNANVDERFAGTFNNVFYANNATVTAYPKWKATETLGNGTVENTPAEMVDNYILEYGDSAFVMFKDPIPQDMYYVRGTASAPWFIHKTGHFYCLDISQMYNPDGTINDVNTSSRRSFFDMQKWYDRTRPHNGENQDVIGSQRGKRDFIVFRLPEMHYIIAEASLNQGNIQQAYDYLKIIADKRSFDGNGTAMLQAYGVNSAADVNIDFILDDKSREFAGEQQHWFDLKRTGKTLERIRAHNPDAAGNITEKHIVRPIPQVELDAIENKEDYVSGPGIY